MRVNFYNNLSDNIVADKKLTSLGYKDVTLTGDNIKESPSLLLQYDETLLSANYCYIPTFNRYYFITPHGLESGARMRFNCKTDLLTSAINDIRASIGTATRTGNKQNNDVVDNLVARLGKIDIEVRTFGDPLPTREGGSFIMINA